MPVFKEAKKGLSTKRAMARLKAKEIFRVIEQVELPFDKIKEFRKEIQSLTKKYPHVLLDAATGAISGGMMYAPKIQTYVLASEVLIKAGKKLDPEIKAATFQNFINMLENPRIVRRQSLRSMNPDYLGTILEGIDSLKIRPSDRRFLRVMSAFGYGNRRQSLVHSLESIARNKENKRASKYAKKLAKKINK